MPKNELGQGALSKIVLGKKKSSSAKGPNFLVQQQ
jgi:hypothetical protein